MITTTIGATGRQEPDVASWESGLGTAGSMTDDETGAMYDDDEFDGGSTGIVISGVTQNGYTILLTAAAGESFQDHANVRTNGLRYNASNGVHMTWSGGSDYCLYSDGLSDITISRLQFRTTGTGNYDSTGPVAAATGTGIMCKDCIIDRARGPNWWSVQDATVIVANCLLVIRTSTADGGAVSNSNSFTTFLGCLLVRPSNFTAGGTAFSNIYAEITLISTGIFGFTSLRTGAGGTFDTTDSRNNATTIASGLPGSNNVHSVTYSSSTPFENASAASSVEDFRAIASTDLIDAGYLDSTNAADDISGTARDSTPTIGPWEVVAGGGGGAENPAIRRLGGIPACSRILGHEGVAVWMLLLGLFITFRLRA